MRFTTQLYIVSMLVLSASALIIISGAAHNVPKGGLAYYPINNSLKIVHLNSHLEGPMSIGSGIGADLPHLWPYH